MVKNKKVTPVKQYTNQPNQASQESLNPEYIPIGIKSDIINNIKKRHKRNKQFTTNEVNTILHDIANNENYDEIQKRYNIARGTITELKKRNLPHVELLKKQIADKCTIIANKCLDAITDAKIEKTSAHSLSVMAKINSDHRGMILGEPTQILKIDNKDLEGDALKLKLLAISKHDVTN